MADSTPDPEQYLQIPYEEEKLLVEHIQNMYDIDDPLTSAEIIDLATEKAVLLGLTEITEPLTVSWYQGFIGRWPNLIAPPPPRDSNSVNSFSRRRKDAEQPIEIHVTVEQPKEDIKFNRMMFPSNVRAAASKQYNQLDKIFDKYGLRKKPHLIFFFDETSFQMDHDEVVTSEDTTAIITTVMASGSAVGQYIPPYFILNGDILDPVVAGNSPPGSSFKVTKTGCSDSGTFLDFLGNHFSKHIPPTSKKDSVLLLYHCHTQYVTKQVIDDALSKYNIILFGLSPYNSPISPPSVISSFGQLKSCYLTKFQEQMSENIGDLNSRHQLCSIISKAYQHSFTLGNFVSVFCESGIHPFDKEKFDEMSLMAEAHAHSLAMPSEKE